MAIIDDYVVDNLKGKWDNENNMWVEPPEIIEEPPDTQGLPDTIKINPLEIATRHLLAHRHTVDLWIKESPTQTIIEQDRDDANNPLTAEVATIMLDLITGIQAGVKHETT
jgi:hypothetical protein